MGSEARAVSKSPTKQADGHGIVANRYAIEEELARGGMAVVYRARDHQGGGQIALKRLLPVRDGSRAERVAALFRREFHTLSQLRHPRIIEVHDYGQDAQGPYYTMELLDGSDLRESAPLPPREACAHLRDVASSLALLHARRLLHRDVSPRNVRITGDGRAKLIDFGALTNFGSANHAVGTPPAVPPEALNRLDMDQRSDLYALGALAYWVLTGRQAYPARSFEQLPILWRSGAPLPPSNYVEGIDSELDDLVLSLLSLDMHGRPPTAADVIDRLTEIADLPEEHDVQVRAAYLANPDIVGRDAELGGLRREFARVGAGHPAGVVVRGPQGMGKTRVLLETALEAQLQGASVARVDAEAQPGPWGAVHELLRSLLVSRRDETIAAVRPHVSLLGHIVPELIEATGVTDLAKLPRDRGEQRMRLQAAVVQSLAALAGEQSLTLVVDNAHAADESSLSVLASLLARGEGTRIAVAISVREGEVPQAAAPMKRLVDACYRVALRGLSQERTTVLAAALFGSAPNHQKLGAWLHGHTGGNPEHCLQLVARLVHEGVAQYEAGSWVLPEEMPQNLGGLDLAQLHSRRLAELTATERTLADVLSVEEVPVPLPKALALSPASEQETFDALAGLVTRGVLLCANERYRFSQRALRQHLLEGLDPKRLRELHDRSGEYALANLADDPLALIDAGWHLLRGVDELRGAQLLEEACRDLTTSIEGLQFAAPALEAALEVFERSDTSPWLMLGVLEALTSAGWYVDYRFAAKYGERALDLSLQLSGLTFAEKLVPVMGEGAALKAGLAWAAARHAVQAKRIGYKKFRQFKGVFAPLVGNVGVLVGIAANLLHGAEARRVLDKARMLRAFEEGHVLSVMYKYATYFTLAAEGRMSEAEPIGKEVYAWFQTEEAENFLGREGAAALSGGISVGLGQFACFTSNADPEEWIERLEQSPLSFYRAMGTQTRYAYHCSRGEMAEARTYREQLEQHAIHGATLWQSSVLVPLLTAAVCARCGDEVGLKYMAGSLERFSESMSMPVLKNYVAVFRAYAAFLRGHASKARGRIEAVLPDVGIHQWIEGPFTMAAYARILLGCGDPEGARRVLRRARAALAAEDFAFMLYTQDIVLAEAEVETATHNYQLAAEKYDWSLQEVGPTHSPLIQFRLHAGRARVALALEDEAAFEQHHLQAQRWAKRTGHPRLMATAKRLRRAADRLFRGSAVDLSSAGGGMFTVGSQLRDLLAEGEGESGRASVALEYAVRASGAVAGYLYLASSAELKLVAAYPRHATPPTGFADELGTRAFEMQRSFTQDDVTCTQTATAALDGIATTTGTGDAHIHGLHTDWLVLERDGSIDLVGALVLCPSEAAPLQRLHVDELGLIADACA